MKIEIWHFLEVLNLESTLTKVEVHICGLFCSNFIEANELIVDFITTKVGMN